MIMPESIMLLLLFSEFIFYLPIISENYAQGIATTFYLQQPQCQYCN